MAVTYDLTTNVGKVRRNIGDTDVDSAHFTDEELQSFLDEVGNDVNLASARALRAWAAALARDDELTEVGSWRGDRRNVVKKMLDLAAEYERTSTSGSGAVLYRVTFVEGP